MLGNGNAGGLEVVEVLFRETGLLVAELNPGKVIPELILHILNAAFLEMGDKPVYTGFYFQAGFILDDWLWLIFT